MKSVKQILTLTAAGLMVLNAFAADPPERLALRSSACSRVFILTDLDFASRMA